MNDSSTLSKILNSINGTLNIANKAMPIYKEAKPIFKTIKTTYSTLKNNNIDLKKMINLIKLKNQIKKDTKISSINTNQNNNKEITYSNTNNPKFFI